MWFKSLSAITKLGVVAGGIVTSTAVLAASNPAPTPIPPATPSAPVEVRSASVTKMVFETAEIRYDEQTVNDSSLPKGQTVVRQEGKRGSKNLTFEVTYVDGVETSRHLISEEVILQPITKIVAVGTKVEQQKLSNDNYYTNVDGNEVHSPAYTSDGQPPPGATAQCNNGTYSFSQNRRGICSSHGGVSRWLY